MSQSLQNKTHSDVPNYLTTDRVIVAFDFGGEDVWLMSARDWACGIGFWYKKEKLVANIRERTDIPFIFTEHKSRRGNVIKRTHSIPNSLPEQQGQPR